MNQGLILINIEYKKGDIYAMIEFPKNSHSDK